MRSANFHIIEQGPEHVCIEDIGPWDKHPSVTNDAEGVVERLSCVLEGRRLFYLDSEGNRDELLVKDGKFAGFAPGPRGEAA
jgi:hypothetical protein